MFAAHKPSDVREKEASARVVWVAVGVTVLVVLSVVPHPDIHAVLEREKRFILFLYPYSTKFKIF